MKTKQTAARVEERAASSSQAETPPQTKVSAYCGRDNPLDSARCRECGTTDFRFNEKCEKRKEQASAPSAPTNAAPNHLWSLSEGDEGYTPECDEAYERKLQEWQNRDWEDWLVKELVFPFVCIWDEAKVSQDASLRGHKLEVLGLGGEDASRGVTVKSNENGTLSYVPLADIDVEPGSDPNFWPVREYGVWFANCWEKEGEQRASALPAPALGTAPAQPSPGLPHQTKPSWIDILSCGFLAVMVVGCGLVAAMVLIPNIGSILNPGGGPNDSRGVPQQVEPKQISKTEWRQKVRPYWNPGGSIRVTTVANFKNLVGEPSQTQTIEGVANWYYECSDGTVQLELIDSNMTGGRLMIRGVNDF